MLRALPHGAGEVLGGGVRLWACIAMRGSGVRRAADVLKVFVRGVAIGAAVTAVWMWGFYLMDKDVWA